MFKINIFATFILIYLCTFAKIAKMPKSRREVEVVIISDVHLGTYGCHAKELLSYLKSVKPKILVLNGDIIDGWAFSKRYFPKSHMAVISELFKLMKKDTQVIYITGNHDEFLRQYTDLQMGNLFLTDKYLLELNGKKHWIFHGDVFDNTTKGWAKMIAKLGGLGYDWLILVNRAVNWLLNAMGRPKVSLSKKVKNSVKEAVKFIADFEEKAIELAIDNRYDFVICGHIHQPADRIAANDTGSVHYLNSGDWIENLTYLEYNDGEWKLCQFDTKNFVEEKIDGQSINLNLERLMQPQVFAAMNELQN